MQEVESRRKLAPADGAHIFFAGVFLTGSYLVKSRYNKNYTNGDLENWNDWLFYGLLIWSTFLVITLLPRYKNEGMKYFFNLIDLLYGFFHAGLLIYGWISYNDPANDSATFAPELDFFAQIYITFTGIVGFLLLVGYLTWFTRRCVNPNDITLDNK